MTTPWILAMLASIPALTGLAWLLRRAGLPHLCPLCAGVVGTWIGLLWLHWAGWAVDPRLPAVLLGGSVVGLAGLGESTLIGRTPGAVLVWKTAFVAVGFATVYGLLLEAWYWTAGGAVISTILFSLPWMVAPGRASSDASRHREQLLAELKNCC